MDGYVTILQYNKIQQKVKDTIYNSHIQRKQHSLMFPITGASQIGTHSLYKMSLGLETSLN